MLVYALEKNDKHFVRVVCDLLLNANANRQADFHQKSVSKAQKLIPNPCADVQGEDVGEERDDPLEEEHAALQVKVCEDGVEFRDSVLHQAHKHMEQDVNRGHVKWIERVG